MFDDAFEIEEDEDDTLDHVALYEWIVDRTNASSTGRLTVESVFILYFEETEVEADYTEVARMLASLYETITIEGELCFKANLSA